MSFLTLPPEINSLLMYSGAGSAPMLEAATAWNGLAAELGSAAQAVAAVVGFQGGGAAAATQLVSGQAGLPPLRSRPGAGGMGGNSAGASGPAGTGATGGGGGSDAGSQAGAGVGGGIVGGAAAG